MLKSLLKASTTVLEQSAHSGSTEQAHAFQVEIVPLEDPSAFAGLNGSGGGAATPRVAWGISRSKVRVGPILDGASCLSCLDYWLNLNRPNAEQWRSLPPMDVEQIVCAWHPAALATLGAVSAELITQGEPRRFAEVDPDTLKVDFHRYLPAPDCTCSAGDDRPRRTGFFPVWKRSPTSFRALDLGRRATDLRCLYVDHRAGLVKHMYRERTSDLLPMWGAESRVRGSDATEIGFGRHEIAEVAESVAILEALERFCGHRPPAGAATVRGNYGDLRARGLPAVDPEDFILNSPSQRRERYHQLAAYTPDLVCDWVWGYSCRRRASVLVPRQLAFYGPGLTPRSEHFVIETSSGCALGGSYEEATFHGLLEAVERDAYMTRWHVKGRPTRIDLDAVSDSPQARLAARARVEGYELHAFSIGLEIPVPTVLAMIVDPRSDAAVASYCASGAHPNPTSALEGALVEVCSSIGVYQRQFAAERERAREMFQDAGEVRSMRDHVLLYSLPETLSRLDFLDRDQPGHSLEALFPEQGTWRSDSLTAELETLIDLVLGVASDVIVVDQTSSVLEPMSLQCVKVLTPGLHPVTFGHQYRRISPDRLASARRHLDQKGEGCEPESNPYPHNFP